MKRTKKGVPCRARKHAPAYPLQPSEASELLDLVKADPPEDIDEEIVISDFQHAPRDPRDPYGKRRHRMIQERIGEYRVQDEHDVFAAWCKAHPEFEAQYEAELASRPQPTKDEL